MQRTQRSSSAQTSASIRSTADRPSLIQVWKAQPMMMIVSLELKALVFPIVPRQAHRHLIPDS